MPLVLIDVFLVGLSPMAADACGPDDCPAELDSALARLPMMLGISALATLALLVPAWALPTQVRHRGRRALLSLLAPLPLLVTLHALMTLPVP